MNTNTFWFRVVTRGVSGSVTLIGHCALTRTQLDFAQYSPAISFPDEPSWLKDGVPRLVVDAVAADEELPIRIYRIIDLGRDGKRDGRAIEVYEGGEPPEKLPHWRPLDPRP